MERKVQIVNRFHAYAGMTGTVVREGLDQDGYFVFVLLDNGKTVMLEDIDLVTTK